MTDPIIRSFIAGFIIFAHDAAIVEQWQARKPGYAPNPFHVQYGYSDVRASEFTKTARGETFCQWITAVVADTSGTVYIAVDPATPIAQVQGTTFSPFVEVNIYGPRLSPCDVNVDGAFNVGDFIVFTQYPFDWNGDGLTDAADYIDLLNHCGG